MVNSLVKSLQEKFPTEKTQFGQCLIVPSKNFVPAWEQQLKNEGCSTFYQSYRGKSCVFVRLAEATPAAAAAAAPTPATRKTRWTVEETEQLKRLYEKRLSFRQIADKLGRSRGSVLGKVQRLGLYGSDNTQSPTVGEEKSTVASENLGDDVIREFLGACALLYPKYPNATAYLLKEASQKILGERRG